MQVSTLTPLELRKFGLMMAFVLIVIVGLLIPFTFKKAYPSFAFVMGSAFLLVAWIKATWLKMVYRVWMKIGHVLGFMNTHIILGIIFFVIITPIGLIMRLIGNDPMNKKYDVKRLSYRKKVNSPPINHMEKPF